MRSIVLLCALTIGCGGRDLAGTAGPDTAHTDAMSGPPNDGGSDVSDRIGAVDLSGVQPMLNMTCEGGVGALALQMPCLVGMNLVGSDRTAPGFHATECRLAQAGAPLVWSFLLPLDQIARDPGTAVQFPSNLPAPPPAGGTIDLAGEPARVSTITGALTFMRVDPRGRAFMGAFSGTVVWRTAAGAEAICRMDGPFWGGPGDFL